MKKKDEEIKFAMSHCNLRLLRFLQKRTCNGRLTKSETGSESEKDQRTSEKDKRINGEH